MKNIKLVIKSFLSYIYNPISMLRIRTIGHYVMVGKGLRVMSSKGVTIHSMTTIGRNCRLSCYKDSHGNLGEIVLLPCMMGDNISIMSANNVTIRKGALLASNITIVSYNHGTNPEVGAPYGGQPLYGKPITIGEYSWIGQNVTICSGVEIGKKSIVGAGSVVTKSVPPYSMVAGNPAKIIKTYNFETHEWCKQ